MKELFTTRTTEHCLRRDILGVRVYVLKREEAIEFLIRRLRRRTKTFVAFANANLINSTRTSGFGGELSRRFVVLNDGLGLDLASLILHGSMFPENLNGTDFTPMLLGAVPSGTRVFLYGAKPDVVKRAAAVLAARYDVSICGFQDGYPFEQQSQSPVRTINEAAPDILLIALGNPLQERWLLNNGNQLDVPLSLCVGAFFDFVAGTTPRAPLWVRNVRLEWLYRLFREPARLWRRYTLDTLAVLVAALRLRLMAR